MTTWTRASAKLWTSRKYSRQTACILLSFQRKHSYLQHLYGFPAAWLQTGRCSGRSLPQPKRWSAAHCPLEDLYSTVSEKQRIFSGTHLTSNIHSLSCCPGGRGFRTLKAWINILKTSFYSKAITALNTTKENSCIDSLQWHNCAALAEFCLCFVFYYSQFYIYFLILLWHLKDCNSIKASVSQSKLRDVFQHFVMVYFTQTVQWQWQINVITVLTLLIK